MPPLKFSQCILVYHSQTLRTEKTNGQQFHLVRKSGQKVSVRFLLWLSIFSRILYNRLDTYISDNNILVDNQLVFGSLPCLHS